MGLFSKKEFVCENCGKKFEARLKSSLCDECSKLSWDMKEELRGYDKMSSEAGHPNSYSIREMEEIKRHRDAIMRKYPLKGGISEAELKAAVENYLSMSEQQAADVLRRAFNSTVNQALCAYYTDNFFVPYAYDGVVVDGKDVFAATLDLTSVEVDRSTGVGDLFAAGMATMIGQALGNMVWFLPGATNSVCVEVAKCILFTNDPYIPMFAFGFVLPQAGKKIKKKERIAGIEITKALLTGICPNMTYEIQSQKDFKKLIKKENKVRCDKPIDTKTFLNRISSGDRMFSYQNQGEELPEVTLTYLKNWGYLTDHTVQEILHMKDRRARKFWEKIATNLDDILPYQPAELDKSLDYLDEEEDAELPEVDAEEISHVDASNDTHAFKAVEAEPGKIWYCPSCGTQCHGKFCPSCGTPRP